MFTEQIPHWREYVKRVPPRARYIGGVILVLVLLLLLIFYSISTETTLWDWLKLLIVPAVIAGVGIWFNQRQNARQEFAEQQRAEDSALDAYLEYMSTLLVEQPRTVKESDSSTGQDSSPWRSREAKAVAKARTLTLLRRLKDGHRKGIVLQFLYESDITYGKKNAFSLEGANLEGAKPPPGLVLLHLDLKGANLQGAALEGADLKGAYLDSANLQGANLKNADLLDVSLTKADLRDIDIEGLTQDQLNKTISRGETQLPTHLDPPKNWHQRYEQRPSPDREDPRPDAHG